MTRAPLLQGRELEPEKSELMVTLIVVHMFALPV